MTRFRAGVVLVAVAAALLLGSPAARAQTSDEPDPSPAAVPARRGYAYPIAWVLPLVFVLGVGAIGRALTRDLREND